MSSTDLYNLLLVIVIAIAASVGVFVYFFLIHRQFDRLRQELTRTIDDSTETRTLVNDAVISMQDSLGRSPMFRQEDAETLVVNAVRQGISESVRGPAAGARPRVSRAERDENPESMVTADHSDPLRF